MGADLALDAIPYCKLTDERTAEIRKVVDTLPDKDLVQFNDDFVHEDYGDLSSMDQAYGEGSEMQALADCIREDVLDNCFQILEEGQRPRDVASVRFPPMEYDVLVTGGLTWSDPPTEAHQMMGRFSNLDPLWTKLMEYAQEDFKEAANGGNTG